MHYTSTHLLHSLHFSLLQFPAKMAITLKLTRLHLFLIGLVVFAALASVAFLAARVAYTPSNLSMQMNKADVDVLSAALFTFSSSIRYHIPVEVTVVNNGSKMALFTFKFGHYQLIMGSSEVSVVGFENVLSQPSNIDEHDTKWTWKINISEVFEVPYWKAQIFKVLFYTNQTIPMELRLVVAAEWVVPWFSGGAWIRRYKCLGHLQQIGEYPTRCSVEDV
uniref:Uncharacterized protein n=1 Tax=Kalanchoe fedtschenkoi TaxID=63787 RepID=A0A7N0UJ39_KALFE